MKISSAKKLFSFLVLPFSLSVTALFADEPNTNASTEVDTNFYIGQSSFPKNDLIEITSVERSADKLVVKGHYQLVSADRALLGLFITTATAAAVPTRPEQTLKISKGSGDFNLAHFDLVPGQPHVTLYSIPDGKAFGGVYFGSKDDAAVEKQMDLGYYADADFASSSSSGPNHALLEYLGNPVEPPGDMNVRYTVKGLEAAVQQAAEDAGITVKKVAVDDSEFPYLVSVVCAGPDYKKLAAQLKKLKDYDYNGGVGNDVNSDGSDTCNVFNLVPYREFPSTAGQRIYHRLWLRQQVFYDSVNHH